MFFCENYKTRPANPGSNLTQKRVYKLHMWEQVHV